MLKYMETKQKESRQLCACIIRVLVQLHLTTTIFDTQEPSESADIIVCLFRNAITQWKAFPVKTRRILKKLHKQINKLLETTGDGIDCVLHIMRTEDSNAVIHERYAQVMISTPESSALFQVDLNFLQHNAEDDLQLSFSGQVFDVDQNPFAKFWERVKYQQQLSKHSSVDELQIDVGIKNLQEVHSNPEPALDALFSGSIDLFGN